MAVRYPPYRPPETGRLGRTAALGHALHVAHVFGTRLAAVALYIGAVGVVLAITAPVAPWADLFRRSAPDAPTYAASAPARHLVVRKTTSVSAVALRFGTTPFALYALNGHRLDGPVVRHGTRLRLPGA